MTQRRHLSKPEIPLVFSLSSRSPSGLRSQVELLLAVAAAESVLLVPAAIEASKTLWPSKLTQIPNLLFLLLGAVTIFLSSKAIGHRFKKAYDGPGWKARLMLALANVLLPASAILVIVGAVGLVLQWSRSDVSSVIFLLRSGEFGAGVTPILPLLLLIGLALIGAMGRLDWAARVEALWPVTSDLLRARVWPWALQESKGLWKVVSEGVSGSASHLVFISLWAGAWLQYCLLRWVPTVEGRGFDGAILLLLLTLSLSVGLSGFRTLRLFLALRRFLESLRLRHSDIEWRSIHSRVKDLPNVGRAMAIPRVGASLAIREAMIVMMSPDGSTSRRAWVATQYAGLLTSAKKLARLVSNSQQEAVSGLTIDARALLRTHATAIRASGRAESFFAALKDQGIKADETQLKNVRAASVVSALQHIVALLRSQLFIASGQAVLLLVAVSSYGFPSGFYLARFCWLLIVFVVGLSLVALVSLERNRMLSWLSGTEPGVVQWNRDFVMRLLTTVILPLLAAFGADLPSFSPELASRVAKLFQ
jgi:hypothetical protein